MARAVSVRSYVLFAVYVVVMFAFLRSVARKTGPSPTTASQTTVRPVDANLAQRNDASLVRAKPALFKSPLPPCKELPSPAIVLLTYNRPLFLERTLRSLLALPHIEHYQVYISQDGSDIATMALARQYAEASPTLIAHWVKERAPLVVGQPPIPVAGYVAQHYKWALDRVFGNFDHSHAIIVEDDMEFSYDFLNLFERTAGLLDADPTLLCVSSWNDNSRASLGMDAQLLMRSSYFPGLGWMLKKGAYFQHLQPAWPMLNHWDNWLRANLDHMDCIVPSLPRNRNFGSTGSSMNSAVFNRDISTVGFYDKQAMVDFGNVDYLLNVNYEKRIRALLSSAVRLERANGRDPGAPHGLTYLLLYSDTAKFVEYASFFHIWAHPRAHYQFLQVLEYEGDLYLIADKRFCPLLPDHMRIMPSADVSVVPGAPATDCDAVCERAGQVCSPNDMPWLNNCRVLKQNFACEKGCLLEAGNDIPAYVSVQSMATYGFCVRKMHNEQILCNGLHLGTSRLCACVHSH